MLRVITYVLAILIWYKIARATHEDEALGYLLISPILTIPLFIAGNSGSAALYTFDVALFLFGIRFVNGELFDVVSMSKTVPGYIPLLSICVLAVISSLMNWAFIEPDVVKYYIYCTIKYCEFAAMGLLVGVVRLRKGSIRRIAGPFLWGATICCILLVLHLVGAISLGGEKYYAAADPSSLYGANDRQYWFLAGFKALVGANASVCAFAVLGFLPAMRSKRRPFAFALVAIIVVAITLTTSRSDLVGIVGGVMTAMAMIAFSTGRWKSTLLRAVAVIVVLFLLGGAVMWSRWDEKSRERISELWDPELRAQGTYRDRQYDAKALPAYMITMPLEGVIGAGPGNYERYVNINVTRIGLGHNAYRSILGELGWFGLAALLVWCFQVGRDCVRSIASGGDEALWAAASGGLLVDRMLASWTADSLLSPMTMGGCNLFAVGVLYMLLRFKRSRLYTSSTFAAAARSAVE